MVSNARRLRPPSPAVMVLGRSGFTLQQLAEASACTTTHWSYVLRGERAMTPELIAHLRRLGGPDLVAAVLTAIDQESPL